jgi:hypothetical protein
MPDQPRQIVGIVWREGNRAEMTYSDGEVDHVLVSQDTATAIAEDEGLARVPTQDDSVQWVKDPGQRETPAQDAAWEDEGGASE